MPELRHLRYFVAVAQELSFSHAVRLTAAGERLLERGVPALAAVEGAFADAARAGRGVLGTLRLGSSPAARHELRPELVARVRATLPEVELELSEATSGTLRRELLGGRLDAALLVCPEPVPGLVRQMISADAVHVLMRTSHRLAGRDAMEIGALRGDRFVVPGAELNGEFHRRLLALCGAAGFEPATVVAGVIWDAAEWPPGDDVVTLTTERWARHLPAGLCAPRLEPAERMPIDLAWRERDESPLLQSFLEFTRPRVLE
jgi:DNA-binding transcriptional LysR family regulator